MTNINTCRHHRVNNHFALSNTQVLAKVQYHVLRSEQTVLFTNAQLSDTTINTGSNISIRLNVTNRTFLFLLQNDNINVINEHT